MKIDIHEYKNFHSMSGSIYMYFEMSYIDTQEVSKEHESTDLSPGMINMTRHFIVVSLEHLVEILTEFFPFIILSRSLQSFSPLISSIYVAIILSFNILVFESPDKHL